MKIAETMVMRLLVIGAAGVNVMCQSAGEPDDPSTDSSEVGGVDDESSGGSSSGTDEESGADESLPGSGEEQCEEDSQMCEDGALQTCEDGKAVLESCEDVCEKYGFSSGDCDGDQCGCDDILDDECATGAVGFCVCAKWLGSPCEERDALEIYVECYQGDPDYQFARCIAAHVDGDQIDCGAALNNCL